MIDLNKSLDEWVRLEIDEIKRNPPADAESKYWMQFVTHSNKDFALLCIGIVIGIRFGAHKQ